MGASCWISIDLPGQVQRERKQFDDDEDASGALAATRRRDLKSLHEPDVRVSRVPNGAKRRCGLKDSNETQSSGYRLHDAVSVFDRRQCPTRGSAQADERA